MNPRVPRQHMGHSSPVMTARYTGEIPFDDVQEAFFQHGIGKYWSYWKTAALHAQLLTRV
jgi:hypothetical protein